MKKKANISSTEELLDLIKGTQFSEDRLGDATGDVALLRAPTPGGLDEPRTQARGCPLDSAGRARLGGLGGFGRLFGRRRIMIGVEMGSQFIRLAKLERSTQPFFPSLAKAAVGRAALVDVKIIPLSGAQVGQDQAEPLRAALTEFLWPERRAFVWASIPAAGVTVWRTTLPLAGLGQQVNAALWSARREKKITEIDNILDFQLECEVIDKGAPKLAATLAAAPRGQVEEIKSLFQKAGFPLSGLTTPPFALQNLFEADWIKPVERIVAILHVGRMRSRIDIFEDKRLLFTRAIMAGVNSMLESLLSELEETREESSLVLEADPAEESEKEASPAQLALAERVLRSLGSRDEDCQQALDQASLTREGVLLMIEPALDRLARQVERTFDHFATTLGRSRVERVFVCGEAGAFPGVVSYLEGQLGLAQGAALPIEPADAADWGEADIAEADRAQVVSCVGLAHSLPGLTPNFLFTKGDEAQAKRLTAWNIAIGACFAAAALALVVYSAVLRGRAHETKAEIIALQDRLASTTPLVDRQLLEQAAEERRSGLLAQNRALRRGYPSALLAELAALAPVNIRLLAVQADLDRREKPKTADPAGRNERKRKAVVEGVSFGGRDVHAATLAEYLIRLRGSPLLAEANAKEGGTEVCPGLGEGQRFTLTLGLK